MTLGELADYADILGGVTVVGGVIFGLIQVVELKKQRREAIAAELMRSFYNSDLADALALIRTLPDHCSAAELRAHGPELERAAILLSMTFETMGLLVHRRIAEYDFVQNLAGGMVVVMWRKLDAWLIAIREEQSQPSWAEWFQWLAEQAAARKNEQEPAYVACKDWEP